ncbi:hypothetical protein Hanom_Chr00s000002g01599871 [Helianthus anomalus]
MMSFNNLMQEYDIKPEWNPMIPSKKDTIFPLKQGKITLFSDFFKFCNFRLPITKFCKSVLDEYQIHISQMHPLGLVKLRHFEFSYIALGHIPEITVFRAFFVLIPASSRDKDWKKKFFYIDASVIPGEMYWREMGAKDKFKDDEVDQRPSECTVIPKGALVMAGISLLWCNRRLYPAFQRLDEGEWSLFDFVDPPRNATLMSADHAVGEQEPDVLKILIDQFLLPVIPADLTAYVSQPPPSGGSSVSIAETKKPSRIKITGRKVITAGSTTSPVAVSISAARRVLLLLPPPLAQVEGGSSVSLSYVEIVASATGGQSAPLADLIYQASAIAVSSTLPSPLFTTAVVVTPSSVTTPLFSSSTPVSLFDSPVGIFSASEKEMPPISLLASPQDLYAQDKHYQPKWKIAESSMLVSPPVVHHWVERAYPPAESAYVEGLDNENPMNAMMVDAASQPWRLAEIRRRWMHDNNELHKARITIQELMDEKYHLESQLQAAGLRESRFVSEKKQGRGGSKACDSQSC